MKVDIKDIKKLRLRTGAPIIDVKRALEETDGNMSKAKQLLDKKGFEKADRKAERETKSGRVFVYQHHSGTITSMVELFSETDFVARNEVFEELGKEIAMQVASMDPKDSSELLGQDYIRDTSKTIGQLLKGAIARTGENIELGRFVRFDLGKEK